MAKKFEAIILLACAILVVLTATVCRQLAVIDQFEGCEPPVLNYSRPQITHYELLFTDEDLHAVASTIAGEAGNCTLEQQYMVAWVVCNRFDKGYASTLAGVCRAPGQFHGYGISPSQENLAAAYNVLHRWSLERQGVEVYRELGPEYLWFRATGDGVTNTFRSVY